jgi:hypothetical protein
MSTMLTLSTRTEIHKDVLRRLADARLDEFEVLRTATPPRNAGALYLAGYAVEALLKCAICRTLNLDELPVVFHTHDLEALLFFSGWYKDMMANPAVYNSFIQIRAMWNEQQRYTDPPTVTTANCDDMNVWLNDPVSGVVPWLKARL